MRVDGAPRHGPVLRRPLPQRGLLRRREEAQRDPAAGASSSPSSPSSTRPTPASTSTRCRSWPTACNEVRAAPTSACCSSPTTSACSTSCSPTACTSSSTAASSQRRPGAGRAARGRGLRRRAAMRPPMTATATTHDSARRRRASRLPAPVAQVDGTAARATSTRRHTSQKPRAVHRRDGPLLRDDPRQRPPRRLRHRRGGHRRLSRRPGRKVARFIGAPSPTRWSSPRTPPRRSTWWPTTGAGPTSAPATSSCSPRWSTTPTSCRGRCWPRRPASSCAGCRSPPTASST